MGGANLTSSDGYNWTTNPSLDGASLNAVAYGGGVFAAVGCGTNIYTSVNGSDWSRRSGMYCGTAIAFGNDTFVAVDGGGSILQSDPLGAVDTNGPSPGLDLKSYAGLTITGLVGRVYRIDGSSDLGQVTNWQPLTYVTLSTSPYLWVDTQSPAYSSRFYRAVLLP